MIQDLINHSEQEAKIMCINCCHSSSRSDESKILSYGQRETIISNVTAFRLYTNGKWSFSRSRYYFFVAERDRKILPMDRLCTYTNGPISLKANIIDCRWPKKYNQETLLVCKTRACSRKDLSKMSINRNNVAKSHLGFFGLVRCCGSPWWAVEDGGNR